MSQFIFLTNPFEILSRKLNFHLMTPIIRAVEPSRANWSGKVWCQRAEAATATAVPSSLPSGLGVAACTKTTGRRRGTSLGRLERESCSPARSQAAVIPRLAHISVEKDVTSVH